MTAANAAVPQLTVAERQVYEEDKETVVVGRPTLLEHLRHASDRVRAVKGMKRTALTAGKVAQALWRMKTTESYREEFGANGFSRLCRHLKISRCDAYDAMNLVDVTASVPPDAIAKLGGLTRRQAKILRRVPANERADMIEEAAATGQTAPAGLERLRQRLQERSLTNEALKEGEVPKQKKERASGLLQSIRKCVTMLRHSVAMVSNAAALISLLDEFDEELKRSEVVAEPLGA
jgi:hypothetical protein